MASRADNEEGASPREIVLEACRRNNTTLLQEVLNGVINTVVKSSNPDQPFAEAIAQLLNTAVDGIGNHCLHLAASSGNYEILDMLLDQEGLEVDPRDRLEQDTPLHKSVRYVNDLPKSEWETGKEVVDLLLDAGADPRIRNKANLKAMELVDPANSELRSTLRKAEYALMAGADVIDRDEDDDDDDEGGSASDDD